MPQKFVSFGIVILWCLFHFRILDIFVCRYCVFLFIGQNFWLTFCLFLQVQQAQQQFQQMQQLAQMQQQFQQQQYNTGGGASSGSMVPVSPTSLGHETFATSRRGRKPTDRRKRKRHTFVKRPTTAYLYFVSKYRETLKEAGEVVPKVCLLSLLINQLSLLWPTVTVFCKFVSLPGIKVWFAVACSDYSLSGPLWTLLLCIHRFVVGVMH